jgi:transposase-like protein
LIISDAHAGLKAARLAVFGGVPWQCCQFHLQQNAQAYVPRQDLKAEVAADIRAIFNAPNRLEAEGLLTKTVQKYAKTAARLATWLEQNLPEGFTAFAFPEAHRRLIGPPMACNGSTGKSGGGPRWSASFQTKRVVYGWSALF